MSKSLCLSSFVAAITLVFVLFSPAAGNDLLSRAQKAVLQVEDVSYTATRKNGPDFSIVLSRNGLRADSSDGASTMVVDFNRGISLHLLHKKKYALLTEGGVYSSMNLFQIVNPTAHATKSLPARVIDGIDSHGFEIHEGGSAWNVWVNAKSGLPIRLEEHRTGTVLSEFVFNPRLGGIDTTVPADYQLKRQIARSAQNQLQSAKDKQRRALELLRDAKAKE